MRDARSCPVSFSTLGAPARGTAAATVVFLASVSSALASPLESVPSVATDTASQSVFARNPTFVLSAKSGATFGETVENKSLRMSQTDTQTGDNVTVATAASVVSRGVAFTSTPASSLTLGVSLAQTDDLDKSDTHARGPDLQIYETRREREARVVCGARFTPQLSGGLVARYEYFHNVIVGNPFGAYADRTEYSGSLFGGGIGASFAPVPTVMLAAAYLSSSRGKAGVSGDEKETSEPALITAGAHLELTKTVRVGLSFDDWQYDRDDLATPTTSPNPGAGNMRVDLRGVTPDRQLFLLQSVAAGLDVDVAQHAILRMSLARESYQYVTDASAVPGRAGTGGSSLWGLRGKAALALSTSDVRLEMGIVDAWRAGNPSSPDTNGLSSKYLGTELSFFGTASLDF